MHDATIIMDPFWLRAPGCLRASRVTPGGHGREPLSGGGLPSHGFVDALSTGEG